MGFRVRKSFKVIPGVRVTISKRGLSSSVGVRGARITRTASGRVTGTVGVPGTGISHTKTISGTRKRKRPASAARSTAGQPVAAQVVPIPAARPGLFAPRWEKQLFAAISRNDQASLSAIARGAPAASVPAAIAEGMFAFQRGDDLRALELLAWVWGQPGRVESIPFVSKYLLGRPVTVTVEQGVAATFPWSQEGLGLALAELHQRAGAPDQGILVVEQVSPSQFQFLKLAELYLQAGRNCDVISMTNRLGNTDDITALLVAYRGIAFRESGNYTAARESFKEALKSSNRGDHILRFARFSRARSYIAEGKFSMARRDLERVMSEDVTYPGLQEQFDLLMK